MLLAGEDNPIEEHQKVSTGAGSCVIIVATDAPLLPGQVPGMLEPYQRRTTPLAGQFSG